MIVKRNKIILATRLEMFNIYIERELYEIYDFDTFMAYCQANGTKIEETLIGKIKFYDIKAEMPIPFRGGASS